MNESENRNAVLISRQLKQVREHLLESGYRADLLKQAMEHATEYFKSNSPSFDSVTGSLRYIQSKCGIEIDALKVVDKTERDSLPHTISQMNPENRKKTLSRFFQGNGRASSE